MISSSLATANRPGQDEAEREEMFAIAAKEAATSRTPDYRLPRLCASAPGADRAG